MVVLDDEGVAPAPTSGGRVAMLVKNTFEFDARVDREARTLTANGWQVRVVAVHDGGSLPLREERNGVEVVRVPRVYGRLAALGPASTVAPRVSDDERDEPGRARSLLRAGARVAMPVARLLNTVVVDQRMALAAARGSPDVVHAHDLNTLGVGARVAGRLGARLIYDSHELHTHRTGDGWLARCWAGVRERRHIKAVDTVITSSDAYADYLARRYRLARPEVVRNVPDAEPVTDPVDLHAELGLDRSRYLLLYQGSVQPSRGLEQAIEALAWLPGWDLVVIGYGAHRPALQQLASRRGISARVHFVGPVAHHALLRWTAGADAGLCLIQDRGLSYRWSLPNKLFEYALAGVPVVASDFGEIAAMVEGEGLGVLCEPDVPYKIARAVTTLGEGNGLRVPRRCPISWPEEAERLVGVYAKPHKS